MTSLADCPEFLSADGLSRAGARPLGFENRLWQDGALTAG